MRAVVGLAVVAGLLTGCGDEEKKSAPAEETPVHVPPPVAAPLTAALAAKTLPKLTVPGIPKENLRTMDAAELLCSDHGVPGQQPDYWCDGLLYGGSVWWVKQSEEPKKSVRVTVMAWAYQDAQAARAAFDTSVAEYDNSERGEQRTTVSEASALGGEQHDRFRRVDPEHGPTDSSMVRSGAVVMHITVEGAAREITPRIPEYGQALVAAAQRAQSEALAAKATV
ncbi:hypothetical protein ACFVIM_03195 [Streptomyces sp. NPDC057638]|uniref:hypothetical protein n=1 Tax=Streptomyces sp. NPDC057638 TaxID=3346190 RepID=UPI00368D9D68